MPAKMNLNWSVWLVISIIVFFGFSTLVLKTASEVVYDPVLIRTEGFSVDAAILQEIDSETISGLKKIAKNLNVKLIQCDRRESSLEIAPLKNVVLLTHLDLERVIPLSDCSNLKKGDWLTIQFFKVAEELGVEVASSNKELTQQDLELVIKEAIIELETIDRNLIKLDF